MDSDKVKYKVGDSKYFKGITYYFCDGPLHRNRLKWHTHKPDNYRTRTRWLIQNGCDASDGQIEANIGSANPSEHGTDTNGNISESQPETDVPSDIQALLASDMNLVTDNDVLRDQIAKALNASANI